MMDVFFFLSIYKIRSVIDERGRQQQAQIKSREGHPSRIDFSSIAKKILGEMKCFRNMTKIIFHRQNLIRPFALADCANISPAKRNKRMQTVYYPHNFSMRLFLFQRTQSIQNYDSVILYRKAR